MKYANFKRLKIKDWVMIENLCYGWSKDGNGTIAGDTGPYLAQVQSVGPNFIEYQHYSRIDQNGTSSATGTATRRQIVCKLHERDITVIKKP